jgi:hypothetical protein
MQSISLINRLITVPLSSAYDGSDARKLDSFNKHCQSMAASLMYSLLVKSINQQNQSSLLTSAGVGSAGASAEADASANEIINKNKQFIFQLNLMMSQSSSGSSNANDHQMRNTEPNWFHLLIQIAKHKPNQILDCLLFSLFRKISQLTPRLLGSLLGPFTGQMHSIVLSKLKFTSAGGQQIGTLCEFLCSLVECQPGFFQTLTDLKIEHVAGAGVEKFTEGSRSLFTALFGLLDELKTKKDSPDYYASMAGLFSIFYTIWAQKKIDYMNYCRQKPAFWSSLAAILKISQKAQLKEEQEQMQLLIEDSPYAYLAYFDFDTQIYENEVLIIDELILESNIKCVSYSFKIIAMELYECVYLK